MLPAAKPVVFLAMIEGSFHLRPSPSTRELGMLELQRFLIKEHVALLERPDTFEIIDPETSIRAGIARGQIGKLARLLRYVLPPQLIPTRIDVCEGEDESLVFTIRRPIHLWRPGVEFYDAEDHLVGYFKSKIGFGRRGFWVYDSRDRPFAEVKGNWVGRSFCFVTADGQELGVVSKKWAGLGKELLTWANNYLVSMNDEVVDQPFAKMLLLGTALAIDLVFYP